jgi:lipoprotein NlpI
MRACLTLLFLVSVTVTHATPGATLSQTKDELLAQARTAWEKRDPDKALELAGKAIELAPKDAGSFLLRGSMLEALQRHNDAVADFDKCLEIDPKRAEAYNRRGSEQFKRGKIKESLADFDRYLELKPEDRPGHWKRGISLYYAGRFDEGRKQFEGYEKVDTNDVENAVWHFLCTARDAGVDKARAAMLKIGNDKRVPMMKVYDLYRGRAKPEDVLTDARAGEPNAKELNQRLFYAHLYLGLYYEAVGDKKKALEHVTLAAEKYKIEHYVGDVARVHRDLLRQEAKRE